MEYDERHEQILRDTGERIAHTRQQVRDALMQLRRENREQVEALRTRVIYLEREKTQLEDALLWLARREVERMGALPDVGTVPDLVYEAMEQTLAA